MKEGWTYKKLGDLALSMADGPFGSNLKKEHYTERNEVRIIQLSNIGENGWKEENTKYTTYEHLETIKRSEVVPGDIVIAKMMPAGRAIICPSHESKYVLSSDAVRVTLKEGLDTRFILFSINSPYFRRQVYENVSGSGRVRTSLTKLRDCYISLPPLPEQRAIVARLDSAFAHIDSLKANAEKQLSEARTLFQKALEEAMTPKEGWEAKTLGEITTRITDGSHNPPRGLDLSEYEMLSSKNVRNDHFTFDNPRYLSKEDFEKEDKRTNLEKGDVLLTIVGAGLGDCCVYEYDKKIVFQRSVSVIKPSIDIISSRFLMYTLQHNYNSIRNKSNGAAQKGIYLKQLAAYETYLPPLSTQHTIVAHLDALSSHVRALEEKLRKMKDECDALKQAMLREIFE